MLLHYQSTMFFLLQTLFHIEWCFFLLDHIIWYMQYKSPRTLIFLFLAFTKMKSFCSILHNAVCLFWNFAHIQNILIVCSHMSFCFLVLGITSYLLLLGHSSDYPFLFLCICQPISPTITQSSKIYSLKFLL